MRPKSMQWLDNYPRRKLHGSSTNALWLNYVELLCTESTSKAAAAPYGAPTVMIFFADRKVNSF